MKWLQVSPAEFKTPPKDLAEMEAFLASNAGTELVRDEVVLESEIGAGEFGSVHSGFYRKAGSTAKVLIAVKMLKDATNPKQKVKFLQEATIMAQFRHPKIVNLIGVVTKSEPVMICLEFVELGSLLGYLKSDMVTNRLLDHELVRMACDVCSAMHYLSESGFVHRDLAARNVLISKDFTCKVCDFGLSQEAGEDSSNDKDERIPIRWTSPEAVNHHQFSVASDVWSFGILLWEMWSYGAMPYKGWTNDVVMSHVNKGYRLPTPAKCPEFIYGLMLEIWDEEPSERPAFYGIFERLLAAWNLVKPMGKYGKAYEAGNKDEEVTEEEGDMYDLGGDTDKQVQAKRRVVRSKSNLNGGEEEWVEVEGDDDAPAARKPAAKPVQVKAVVVDSDEEEGL
jgi:serine/threonine protein kinase